jgi:hypothetical protein
MPLSFTENFNHLNENISGFTRPDALSRIPAQPALMDELEKTAREAAAAFPGNNELGRLMVLPIPGWGAPLFATDSVMQELVLAAARKQVEADPHFKRLKDATIGGMEAYLRNMETEASMTQKKLDDTVDQMKGQIEQMTRQAMDELMRPDDTRDKENVIMQTDPKQVDDVVQHIIREATTAYTEQARSNGTLALPNAKIDIKQSEGNDESGNPDIKNKVVGQIPVQLIGLAVGANFQGAFPATFTSAMESTSAMDLAIGNILFKSDPDAAEAFAALRHRQRYPHQQTDYTLYRNEALASAVILNGDASRYAANALDLAMKKADELGDNIAALSLKDIAGKAEDIADQAVPEGTGAKMDKIEAAFEPVTDYYQSYLGKKTTDSETQARAKITEMVLATQMKSADADVQQVAGSFLAHPETQAFMKANAADIVSDEVNAAKPAAKAAAPRN